jgi:hypothetical protein
MSDNEKPKTMEDAISRLRGPIKDAALLAAEQLTSHAESLKKSALKRVKALKMKPKEFVDSLDPKTVRIVSDAGMKGVEAINKAIKPLGISIDVEAKKTIVVEEKKLSALRKKWLKSAAEYDGLSDTRMATLQGCAGDLEKLIRAARKASLSK